MSSGLRIYESLRIPLDSHTQHTLAMLISLHYSWTSIFLYKLAVCKFPASLQCATSESHSYWRLVMGWVRKKKTKSDVILWPKHPMVATDGQHQVTSLCSGICLAMPRQACFSCDHHLHGISLKGTLCGLCLKLRTHWLLWLLSDVCTEILLQVK